MASASTEWRTKNPEKAKLSRLREEARRRERYATDPEYRRRALSRFRSFYASDPLFRARISIRAQERNMINREKHRETACKSYRKRKAAAQAEWSEVMAEIQGATDV